MLLRGRAIRIMSEPEDLHLMPDERLNHLGEQYMTEPRAITFDAFLRYRNLAQNNELYSRRRDLKNAQALPAIQDLRFKIQNFKY